jgi:uncharacterized protein YjiS (DUF1127 family)
MASHCQKANPDSINISTYNLRTSINNWKDKNGNLLPGMPPPHLINPIQIVAAYLEYIQGCVILGNTDRFKIEKHAIMDKWPNIEIRYKKNHHAKCVIIKSKKYETEVFCGSINMSESCWSDVMVKLENKKDIDKIVKKFEVWKNNSKKLV